MERFQLTVNQQKTCIFHLSVRTPQLPYRVTAPLSGVSASRWGEGLQWRTRLSLQTLLNVPHWGTATALTRSRLSTRSLLDVCHRHTATEPTGETVAGRAPPGHSNRADRRERQGFSAGRQPAKFQFTGTMSLILIIAHCSFLIAHSQWFPSLYSKQTGLN